MTYHMSEGKRKGRSSSRARREGGAAETTAPSHRRTTVVIATAATSFLFLSLAALTVHHSCANAEDPVGVEDRLCTVGENGEKVCETVFFEPDIYDNPPNDNDEEEEDWFAIGECIDNDPDCPQLAEGGECDNNPGYTKYQCAVSCGNCAEFDAAYVALRDGTGNGPCTDEYIECKNWAAMGECGFNPGFMLVECERSCLVCFEDT